MKTRTCKTMVDYYCKVAYRHSNGDIEGFIGVGRSRSDANWDAESQIKRKIAILNDNWNRGATFDEGSLIEAEDVTGLSLVDATNVRNDWKSGVRY